MKLLLLLHLVAVNAFNAALLPLSQFGLRRTTTSTSLFAATLDGWKIGGEIKPVNNFVLVKTAGVAEQTAGGILLAGSAKIKKTEGTVISVGPGKTHPESGLTVPMPVVPGEGVVYGKYDGTEVNYNGEAHTLIRDDDILVKFIGGDLKLDNVDVLNDNVLVFVETREQETAGGLLVATGSDKKSRPSTGVVVKVGPGRMASSGELIPMSVKVGDEVKFRDFAGNEVDIEGKEYSVVKMADILAKF